MSLLSSIFSSNKSSASPEQQQATLRNDGIRAMQMGEFAYAIRCFQTALDLQPDTHIQSLLAEAFLRSGQPTEALPHLQQLANETNAADNLQVHLLLIQTLGQTNHFDEQLAACQSLLAVYPDNANIHYYTAQALHQLQQPIQAIVHITKCLKLQPESAVARLLRAEILADMQQWNEVITDVNQLLQEDENSANSDETTDEALTLRATAYTSLQQPDQAIADYQTLLLHNPFNVDAILLLGQLYQSTSRWDEALKLYDEAIDLQPNFAEAYKARGGVKHHLKDAAGAADDLKRALTLSPETAHTIDGEYTNIENELQARYKSLNPYGF